jgi:hypothetical protein
MQHTIGILGRARHGKGTLAEIFSKRFTDLGVAWQVVSFADPLKDFLTRLVGRSEPFRGTDAERTAPVPEIGWSDLAELVRSEALAAWPEIDIAVNPSGRQLMQLFGTNIVRDRFMYDTWKRIAGQRAKAFDGITIIDDVRFSNEAEPRSIGGILDRCVKVVDPRRPLLSHASDTAVDLVPDGSVSATLVNDGTIDDLRQLGLAWVLRGLYG